MFIIVTLPIALLVFIDDMFVFQIDNLKIEAFYNFFISENTPYSIQQKTSSKLQVLSIPTKNPSFHSCNQRY